jgi:CDP-diacylglycerol pyrophosphatase
MPILTRSGRSSMTAAFPTRRQHDDPAPCATVDLSAGDEQGYAVLKDINGATQFLLIATEQISGIESPAILAHCRHRRQPVAYAVVGPEV